MSRLLAVLLLSVLAFQATHAQTITVTPASGTISAPATPTVVWDCGAGATSAVASGNWSGAKAVSGTATLGAFPAASHTFAFACTYAPTPVSASIVLNWIPPTTKTDGTALNDLQGYNVYYGTSCLALSVKANVLNTGVSTYTLSNLTAGDWCAGVKAYNPGGESVMSNTATKTVPANLPTTRSASATWVVNPAAPPSPPTGLTAKDPVAYEIKPNSTGTLVATRIGIVPDGTECSSERTQKIGTTVYALVPRGAVDLVNWPANVKLQDVWAKCG